MWFVVSALLYQRVLELPRAVNPSKSASSDFVVEGQVLLLPFPLDYVETGCIVLRSPRPLRDTSQ